MNEPIENNNETFEDDGVIANDPYDPGEGKVECEYCGDLVKVPCGSQELAKECWRTG